MPEASTNPVHATITSFLAGYTAPTTIRGYRADLYPFVTWLEKENICNSLVDLPLITYVNCKAYMGERAKDGCSPATRARVVASMREWFKYLGREGYISDNPASGLTRPKIPKLLPHPPSAARMEHIFNSFDRRDAAWPARDRAIFEVLYVTGASTSELCALDLADIDWEANMVFVGRKGKKGRSLSLGDPAPEKLRTYLYERAGRLRDRKVKEDATPAIFLNCKLRGLNEQASQARLTSRNIQRIIQHIEPNMSPKNIRTACGTHMAENGADVHIVRAQLGYEGFEAAERVMSAAGAGQRQMMQVHPRARLEVPSSNHTVPEVVSSGRALEAQIPIADTVPSNPSEGPPQLQSGDAAIRIDLPGGVTITIERNTDPEVLRSILDKLGA